VAAVTFDVKIASALARAGDWPFWALLGVALIALTASQAMLWPINGFWLDEYFTLAVTDPARPLHDNFVQHIAPDTNPPLYPVLLGIVRFGAADARVAIVVTAALVLAATLAFVILTSRRREMLQLGLVAAAAFTVSGPVVAFFPEGRAYFLAMCIAFANSWVAALDTVSGRRETNLSCYAALGGLASLCHVFGAIFAGSLATGLVAYGMLGGRRDLRDAGLMLGGVTTIVFIAWFATIQGSLGRVGWIEFTSSAVWEAVWYVRTLTVGPGLMLLPVAVILALAFRVRQARPLLIVLGSAFMVFALLPIAASVVIPMVVGRYWAIGAPVGGMLLVFLAWTFSRHRDRTSRWAFVVIGLVLIASTIFGISAARNFTLEKPVWRGAPVVASLGKGCPPGSIRLGKSMYDLGVNNITGLPQQTFVDASDENVLLRPIAHATCPVIGWSEHVDTEVSDEQLLARLHLNGIPDETEILRHGTGYVVLKAGACRLLANCPR
jgi:hypothetical protein